MGDVLFFPRRPCSDRHFKGDYLHLFTKQMSRLLAFAFLLGVLQGKSKQQHSSSLEAAQVFVQPLQAETRILVFARLRSQHFGGALSSKQLLFKELYSV